MESSSTKCSVMFVVAAVGSYVHSCRLLLHLVDEIKTLLCLSFREFFDFGKLLVCGKVEFSRGKGVYHGFVSASFKHRHYRNVYSVVAVVLVHAVISLQVLCFKAFYRSFEERFHTIGSVHLDSKLLILPKKLMNLQVSLVE